MTSAVTLDEFQALEERVLRAVEIVRQEREARAAADAELAGLREQYANERRESDSREAAVRSQAEALRHELDATKSELAALHQERDTVRQRVEKLLTQMDELG